MEINKDYYGCFDKLHSRHENPTCVVVHHTCTATPSKTRSALKKKGYSTHFEIDKDGTVYQYADVMKIACHCGSANVHAIGIDITHMENAKWTDAQYKSSKELAQYLHEKYGIKLEVHEHLEGFYPHKAVGNTDCPQDFDLHRMVDEEDKQSEVSENEEDDDFDVVKRTIQLIGMSMADGRRDELREAIHTHFPLLLG